MPSRSSLSLLVILPLLFATGCLHRPSSAVVVTGTLSGEIVWEGEVQLGGDVILAPGGHLTILPGTTVRFLPAEGFPAGLSEHPYFSGSELIIQGKLTAIGTATAPISFRAADDAAPAGSWGAINFEGGAEGLFVHCILRQADSAIHSRESSVYIEESLLEENLAGIRFNSSVMLIERNLLRGNTTAIRFHFGEPVVCNNRFEGNRVNLFITSHPRDYLFENNIFGAPLDYQVVLGEEVPEDVQLSGNYWGRGATDSALVSIFDGRRDPYLGRVLIEPQLTAPAEGGPAWIR